VRGSQNVTPLLPARRAKNRLSKPLPRFGEVTDTNRRNPALEAEGNGVTVPAPPKPGIDTQTPVRPPLEDTELGAPAREPQRPRRSSALGTDDDLCHVLVNVGLGGYSRTLCGKRVAPPLSMSQTHDPPPTQCPGGWSSCPDCAEAS
jgi:hypothetical protein